MTATTSDGLLVLDKPAGITSRAAVDRAQRWFAVRTRVGHTGTLDPLATGVLVLCLGGATRLSEYVQRMAKTYVSTFLLGARSDSDDAYGLVTAVPGASAPDSAALAAALAEFVGTIQQVPPAYSAAKVAGARAYDLARAGRGVELRSRAVQIYSIDVRNYAYPLLEVKVRCGKGTYIRSLARDLGERLGCGAYVQELRRTRVGPFAADDAVPLDADAAVARGRLLPAALALSDLPCVSLDRPGIERLRSGQAVALPRLPDAEEAAVFDEVGALVAVAVFDRARGLLAPVKVLV
jgi:tRNA pseudouridine55 synthase